MTEYYTKSVPLLTRPWPEGHIGCNVTTCPNGKCRQTGECQDASPRVESPPIAPESPRTIIAFTGLAGAGKSTAAAHLVSKHGFQRVRFAGPLKAMMAALGLTPNQIEGSEKETPCALLGGKTPRHAMQQLGTEFGRNLIDKDLWIRAWQAALPATGNVVVDDCRFPNEAAAIQAAGGIIVRIERPGAGTSAGYQHSSETHALKASLTLDNGHSEANLRLQVDALRADLSWRDLPAYP